MLGLHNVAIPRHRVGFDTNSSDSSERMTEYVEKCVIYSGVMMRERDIYSLRQNMCLCLLQIRESLHGTFTHDGRT